VASLLVEDTRTGGTMFRTSFRISETLFLSLKPERLDVTDSPWNKGYLESTFDKLLVSRSIMKLEFEWHAAKAEANFRNMA
jgi:hypothetical protein